jgi:hypothetical protein
LPLFIAQLAVAIFIMLFEHLLARWPVAAPAAAVRRLGKSGQAYETCRHYCQC